MEWRQFGSVKVSEKGDVQSLNPLKNISARIDNNGYVVYSFDGTTHLAHRLVAHLWLGLELENRSQQVDHKDNDRSNNHWSNLQIVSSGENKRLATKRVYPLDNENQKTCRRCRILKPSTEFGKDRKREFGLATYCRSCTKVIAYNRKLSQKPGN